MSPVRNHARASAPEGPTGRAISNGVRVLQIGADRSKRGILFPNSPAFKRQEAYAKKFGHLDMIGFSLKGDGAKFAEADTLRVYPTNSVSRLMYGIDAFRIARKLDRPDVVSVQDPFETGFIGWIISVMKGVPLHVQVHTDFLSPEYARLSRMNRIRVWVAGFVLWRAQRVRAVSRHIQIAIQKKYKIDVPISVLPIFVDVQKFRNAESNAELTRKFAEWKTKLLVVSRLEQEKNVELAIQAFARAALEDSCLIILGDGSERESLERLAKERGVGKWVFFEGQGEPASYYKLADLVLFPSRYDGYGMVIVEALAAGKPVLSTDVGIAREAGAIIVAEDSFSKAITSWFANGPREGTLTDYPYKNFEEYVQAYCDDVASSKGGV